MKFKWLRISDALLLASDGRDGLIAETRRSRVQGKSSVGA